MKFKYLIVVIAALLASAYLYRVDVTSIPEEKVTQMGFPLPWLEEVATTDANGTVSIGYNVVWHNMLIDVACYIALLWLIFG